jgi:uncharacterized protein YjiS (DUF1127 family)
MSVAPILDLPRPSDRLAAVPAVLTRLAASAMHVIARELRIRRDVRRLAEFDEAMLRDIGITRTDIERAVRLGRSWPASRSS